MSPKTPPKTVSNSRGKHGPFLGLGHIQRNREHPNFAHIQQQAPKLICLPRCRLLPRRGHGPWWPSTTPVAPSSHRRWPYPTQRACSVSGPGGSSWIQGHRWPQLIAHCRALREHRHHRWGPVLPAPFAGGEHTDGVLVGVGGGEGRHCGGAPPSEVDTAERETPGHRRRGCHHHQLLLLGSTSFLLLLVLRAS